MTTKFSFEVPIKYLDDFDEDQDFIFTLSLLLQDESLAGDVYRRYVRDILRQGLRTVWIDNSFNELAEATEEHELFRLFRFYDAQKVISPDSPHWDKDQIFFAFKELLRHGISKDRIITVISSWDMYQYLRENGSEHFAASYWVREENFSYQQLFNIPGLHLLGFLNPGEIKNVQPASCDTSMPIKLALINKTYSRWLVEGCPHINTRDLGPAGRDYFLATMNEDQIKLAKDNIKELKASCSW